MAEDTKPTNATPVKDDRDELVSAARRRALKIGIGAVPVILTLAARPAYSNTQPNPCQSVTMSAASSRGIRNNIDCQNQYQTPY